MAPSKKRTVTARKAAVAHGGTRSCPCLQHPHSDGICALNVWQGTTIDTGPMEKGQRLLRPNLPVVKYKDFTLKNMSGHMYLMILLNWIPLLALFVGIYIGIVGLFALFFAMCNSGPTVSDSKARDYFNLSLQTMATIGYGVLFPKDSCTNWVVAVEAFVSMIVVSLMTGVAFVKFARPRPHMIFSEFFTVSQREQGAGELEMRFRIVNGTRRELIMKGEILEVSFKLILLRIEKTRNDEKKLCYYDLRLKTTSYITLRLEAEIVHNIDKDSPFFGMTEDDMAASDFMIVLMMSGVDETLHDMVHQQFDYTHERMRWGAKFVPILTWDHAANRIDLDFDNISATVPAPIDDDVWDAVAVDLPETRATALSTDTQGNAEMAEEMRSSLENVAGDDDEEDHGVSTLRLAGFTSSSPANRTVSVDAGMDYSDLESVRGFLEDERFGPHPLDCESGGNSADQEDEEDEAQDEEDEEDEEDVKSSNSSGGSTKRNSGSENDERHEATPVHHTRFDERSRTTSLRILHMNRRRRHGSGPATVSTGPIHAHEAHEGMHDQPMSLLRRRVRFKNHPLSRFSKGLYYRALETSWGWLFLWLALIYFSAIAIIALLMHLSSENAILQTADVQVVNSYERFFFFCAQTLSTIGYGSLSPNPDSHLVNFYVFLLAFIGVIVATLVTGLAWAKFSIPNASTLVFSDCLLLSAFHLHRAVMFRAANSRTFGAIIEGSFRISVVILNQRLGHKETHELKLVRNVWPVVQFGTTVTHIIDDNSPLYDISTDELLSGHHFFVVLFTGLDPVVNENMFARKTYHSCDILVGHHFADNMKLASDGVHIDLEAINDTMLTPDADLRGTMQALASAEDGVVADSFQKSSLRVMSHNDDRFGGDREMAEYGDLSLELGADSSPQQLLGAGERDNLESPRESHYALV